MKMTLHLVPQLHLFLLSSSVAGSTTLSGCYLSSSNVQVYAEEGDMIFGGLAPVHLETVPSPSSSLFTGPPVARRCANIHMEQYQSVLAMVFATKEINQNLNILPQVKLGFQVYDSCFSEAAAIEGSLWMLSGHQKTVPNYSCMANLKTAAIIGDLSSAGTLPVARILGVSRYPQVSYGAGLSSLSDKVQFPSFLRTIASAGSRAHAFIEMLLHFGWTWIGILAADNDYGLENGQKLLEEAPKNGICIEFFETLATQTTQKSLSHAVKVIRQSTSRVIVCFTFSAQMISLLKEIALKNLTGKVWVANTSWFPSPVFAIKDLWQTLHGTVGFAVYSGEIPMFKEFLYSIHPSKFTNDIFMKQFWERAFSCQWTEDLNTTDAGKTPDGKKQCSRIERLDTLDVSVYDVHNFRYPYAAYNAIYALAQALHDLNGCTPTNGPFANGTCAEYPDFQPWQVRISLMFYSELGKCHLWIYQLTYYDLHEINPLQKAEDIDSSFKNTSYMCKSQSVTCSDLNVK